MEYRKLVICYGKACFRGGDQPSECFFEVFLEIKEIYRIVHHCQVVSVFCGASEAVCGLLEILEALSLIGVAMLLIVIVICIVQGIILIALQTKTNASLV